MEDEQAKVLHEHLEQILDRQITWISGADSKAAVILPVCIAMIGAIAAVSPTDSCAWNVISIGLTAISLGLLVSSVLFLGATTFPRTSGPEGSLIYFGGISSKPLESYRDDVLSLTTIQYTEDLINQAHRNAQIAEAKHAAIKKSIALLYLAVLPWAFTVYMHYDLGIPAWH